MKDIQSTNSPHFNHRDDVLSTSSPEFMAMTSLLFSGLAAYWKETFKTVLPEFGAQSWILCVIRSLRAIYYLKSTLAILSTETYKNHGRGPLQKSLIHYIFSRYYLKKGLSNKNRSQLALNHILFEEATFNSKYFESVYGGDGLILWSHDTDKAHFRIVLRLGGRMVPEGDLRVCLLVNNEPLSQIGFTWVRDASGFVPFIARNQARWKQDTWVLDLFEGEFPQNSSMLFTYAALQGLATAVGSKFTLAVCAEEQIVFKKSEPKSFVNSYDGFWEKLGGTSNSPFGYRIPVPFHVTPLEKIASKHRKRAIQRRRNWQTIEGAARCRIESHFNVNGTLPD